MFLVLLSCFDKFDNKVLCRNDSLMDFIIVLQFTVVQKVTKYFGFEIGYNFEFISLVLLRVLNQHM